METGIGTWDESVSGRELLILSIVQCSRLRWKMHGDDVAGCGLQMDASRACDSV